MKGVIFSALLVVFVVLLFVLPCQEEGSLLELATEKKVSVFE